MQNGEKAKHQNSKKTRKLFEIQDLGLVRFCSFGNDRFPPRCSTQYRCYYATREILSFRTPACRHSWKRRQSVAVCFLCYRDVLLWISIESGRRLRGEPTPNVSTSSLMTLPRSFYGKMLNKQEDKTWSCEKSLGNHREHTWECVVVFRSRCIASAFIDSKWAS